MAIDLPATPTWPLPSSVLRGKPILSGETDNQRGFRGWDREGNHLYAYRVPLLLAGARPLVSDATNGPLWATTSTTYTDPDDAEFPVLLGAETHIENLDLWVDGEFFDFDVFLDGTVAFSLNSVTVRASGPYVALDQAVGADEELFGAIRFRRSGGTTMKIWGVALWATILVAGDFP